MTIEIADRLIKLRKKHGLSQEELADKLGLSRQAVSKWERAEASPDTDNLICLAKLYGVSLDELLSTDEDLETIVDEQVKKEEEKKPEEGIHITNDGVIINDDEGQQVVINDDGIVCKDKNNRKVKVNRFMAILGCIEGGLFVLAIIAYILLGVFLNMWHNAWVVFFVPEIICSIARAIGKRNAQQFNVTFTAIFAFFFVCMILPGLEANLWHPMWVVFLAIPLYHTFVGIIRKAVAKEEDDDDDDKEEKVVGDAEEKKEEE